MSSCDLKETRKRCYRNYYIAAGIFLLLGVIVLGKLQRSILFPSAFVQVDAVPPKMKGMEILTIKSKHSLVDFFFIKSKSSSPKSGVVFFAHGNAESIDGSINHLNEYSNLGYHVALVEYRGYGRSTGDPSEKGIVEDFIKAYDRVLLRDDVDPNKIVFHGRSLGGGVLASLTRHRKPNALILQSTFTSVEDMADSYFPFASKFVVDKFRSHEAIKALDIPILVFHGTQDEIVPVSHGKALVKIARQATLILYDAGHNDFPPNFKLYWKEIESFLREI